MTSGHDLARCPGGPKRGVPQDEALFNGIADKSGFWRSKAMKTLKKLPDLLMCSWTHWAFIAECYALSPLRRTRRPCAAGS